MKDYKIQFYDKDDVKQGIIETRVEEIPEVIVFQGVAYTEIKVRGLSITAKSPKRTLEL